MTRTSTSRTNTRLLDLGRFHEKNDANINCQNPNVPAAFANKHGIYCKLILVFFIDDYSAMKTPPPLKHPYFTLESRKLTPSKFKRGPSSRNKG